MSVNIAAQYDAALLAYLDNAGYAESNSVAMAKSFVTACTKLLVLLPRATHTREGGLEMDPDQIRKQSDLAQAFVNANDPSAQARSGPSVTRVSFEDFRR